MTLLILALLLANPVRVNTLVDQRIAIGPGKMRHLEVQLPDVHARLECRFEVLNGESGVSVAIVEPAVWQALRRNQDIAPLAATPVQRTGQLAYTPPEPGRYVVVLDNRRGAAFPSLVHLNVNVVWPNGNHADPVRAQILVWSSVTLFLLITAYSLYRIKRALDSRNRWRTEIWG